jgi:acetoin utilization deacetylase AcuC-like enzyme
MSLAAYLTKFNLAVDDCPIFDGLLDFCKLYSGASIRAANHIMTGQADIAVNWSGGLHHAKKWQASGFCYINDIVLAIIELLRFYPRVLYLDIDVHHGDGVQEAFLESDRVMCVSFHRYDGQFFPGTGAMDEVGLKHGKYYSINVPLQENIDDASYHYIFKSIMNNVMQTFRPSVVVMQCGADSLASDRLGCFNMSIKGHGECVRIMKSFNVPLVMLGGGGYTIRNVARCWAYETSILTETHVPNEIPESTVYRSHFGPDYTLHSNIIDPYAENLNSRAYLDEIRIQIAEYLRFLNGAPSVQMQEIPASIHSCIDNNDWQVDEEEDKRPDYFRDYTFGPRRDKEKGRPHVAEYYSNDRDHDT